MGITFTVQSTGSIYYTPTPGSSSTPKGLLLPWLSACHFSPMLVLITLFFHILAIPGPHLPRYQL